MRKKLFLWHGLILFISLASLIGVSIGMMFSLNQKNTKNELQGYLDLARNVLVEERKENKEEEALANTGNLIKLSSKKIRLTLISTSGMVLYDSDTSEIEENHLNRPEIKNLGEFTTRYSSTLKRDMMYLAGLDSTGKIYVRVAIPLSLINDQVNSTIAISLGVFILVLVLSILVDYYSINASLRPLKKEVARLSEIVSQDEEMPKDVEIESLSYQIDQTKKLIVEKIHSLTEEQEKLRFILNSMNQGLLIVDEKMDVVLVNDYIRKVFHYEDKENASLFDITILSSFSELFHKAIEGKDDVVEVKIEERYYLVSATGFAADWLGKERKGVAYSLSDITIDKNLEKAKRDFFANASHELKSPLTSIIGYSEMIKNGFVTDKKEINEDLDRILFESKRMNEIVIQMLELSKLEAKDEKKEKEKLSLVSTIKEIKECHLSEIEKKEITFEVIGDDFSVLMQKEDLHSLLENLIENAIRYNKDKGRITITLNKDAHSFKIEDTGCGIPKKYQERVFERFFRVDKARSRKLGGTGLGLSIVKHICLNESIHLALESIEDEKTIFTLVFPSEKK